MTDAYLGPNARGFEQMADFKGTHNLPGNGVIAASLQRMESEGEPTFSIEGYEDVCPEGVAASIIAELVGEDVMSLATSEDISGDMLRPILTKLMSITTQRLVYSNWEERFVLIPNQKRHIEKLVNKALSAEHPEAMLAYLDRKLMLDTARNWQ